MRTKIEVYLRKKGDKYTYEYMVDMAIGSYGRFEQVATGENFVTAPEAERAATKAAQEFLNRRARNDNPQIRKYLNLEAQ